MTVSPAFFNLLMDIHIELSRAEVEILRSHLPDGSDLSRRLDHSESNVIACSEGESRALLRIAVEYCPEAVKNIQYAMRVAGVRFS